MAISDEERRIFEELQRDIALEDPAFERRMSGSSAFVRGTLINVAIFALGVTLLISGVSLQNILVGIAGFSAMIYSGLRAMTGKGIKAEIWEQENGSGTGPGVKI